MRMRVTSTIIGVVSILATVTAFAGPTIQYQLAERRPTSFKLSSNPPARYSQQPSYSFLASRIFQSTNADEDSLSQQLEDRYLELAATAEGSGTFVKPEVVYVLMYNPGTNEEGVHTTEYPKDSGKEVMLAFESLEESIAFANILKGDPAFPLEPIPTPTPLEQLEAAFQQMDLPIKIVPAEA